jgi:hypothetical protein
MTRSLWLGFWVWLISGIIKINNALLIRLLACLLHPITYLYVCGDTISSFIFSVYAFYYSLIEHNRTRTRNNQSLCLGIKLNSNLGNMSSWKKKKITSMSLCGINKFWIWRTNIIESIANCKIVPPTSIVLCILNKKMQMS